LKLISIPVYAVADIIPLAALDYALGFGFAAASFALYYLIRTERFSPSVLLDLGYGYAIVGAFALGVTVNCTQFPETSGVGWSPVAVWAFLFPIVVPARLWRVVCVALLIAAMDPLSMWVLVVTEHIDAPNVTAARFAPNLFAVILAAPVSRIIYRLGVQVTEARQMGSYQLETLLGKGGMGEVWRAQHQLLARPAAVKLMRPGALGGDLDSQRVVLGRFEREAQATASMRSPHTIQLYDFGVSEDGTFYYVMELLEGLDLETLVERFGPVPPERAIYFLEQICDSLGEAHEMDLIHRDIKPRNLYACRYGRKADFVKVLDFGLVKHGREEDGRDVKLTAEDTISGTPGYMAPEQVLGTSPVDARTDIYAVGCVAYWLVTGQLVFRGGTVMETLMQHAQAPPIPPSQRTELTIPASLEETILSCLEKNPDKRPQSADELIRRLGACKAEAPWAEARAFEWWEKHVPR
jgi:serine/threonine-protein kinase